VTPTLVTPLIHSKIVHITSPQSESALLGKIVRLKFYFVKVVNKDYHHHHHHYYHLFIAISSPNRTPGALEKALSVS